MSNHQRTPLASYQYVIYHYLMVFGTAFVLLNVWAQWEYLRKPGRGPRRVDAAIVQLRRFQTFLLGAVIAIYGQVLRIDRAAYRSAPRAYSKWGRTDHR